MSDGRPELLLDSLLAHRRGEYRRELLVEAGDAKSMRAVARQRARREDPRAKSRAQVSRDLIAASDVLSNALTDRSLATVKLAAAYMDSTKICGQDFLWAMGVTTDGWQVPLSGVIGSESELRVSELLTSMRDEQHLEVENVYWTVDGSTGLRAGLTAVTGVKPAMCTLHAGRLVTEEHMKEPRHPRRALFAAQARARLRRAWVKTDDLLLAAGELDHVARWLGQRGFADAEACVARHKDGTLARHRRGVPLEHHKVVGTTNQIEKAHGMAKQWTRRFEDSTDPDVALARAAAGIALAERSWKQMLPDVGGLDRIPVVVLRERLANVGLAARYEPGAQRLSLAATTETLGRHEEVERALAAAVRLCDRDGIRLELDAQAFARAPARDALEGWVEERGFTDGVRDGVLARSPGAARERAVVQARARAREEGASRVAAEGDPMARLRGTMPEELRVRVAEAALARAPAMVEPTREQVEEAATKLDDSLRAAAAVESEVGQWWDTSWRAAARQLALDQALAERAARPSRDLLAGGARHVLGARRAAWLAGEASFWSGWVERWPTDVLKSEAAAIGAPLAQLEAPLGRVREAADAIAATRELECRERFAAARDATPDHAPAPGRARGAPAIDRHGQVLSGLRRDLYREHGAALRTEVRELEDHELQALGDAVGDPWQELTSRDARQTRGRVLRMRRVVEQERPGVLHERNEAKRDQGRLAAIAAQAKGKAKDVAEQEAGACERHAGLLWARLEDIEEAVIAERARADSADRFVLEHPEAGVHHAIEVEIAERGQALTPPTMEPPGIEPAIDMA